jgi:hypothetical protein
MKHNILANILSLAVTSALIFAACAQDGGRTELKQGASDKSIKQELASPDGASLRLLPDGGWRIYGQGSATYDFNEADDIRGATQDATLRAKANIAKMLRERVQTTDVFNNIMTKFKESSKAGASQDANVSRTEIQQRIERVVSTSDEILRGVVVIETDKKPEASGGTITVVVGVSSKTQQTMDAIRSNQRQTPDGPSVSADVEKRKGSRAVENPNTPEKKRAKTDF